MTRRPPPNSPRAHWEDIVGLALSRAVPIVGANGSENRARKPSVEDQAKALEDLENEGNRVRLHDNGAWADLVDEEVPGPDDHVEDDFQAMLRARARAGIGARSELDLEINYREGQHQEQQQVALSQRINPPSAYKGTLGNQAIIISGRPPILVAQWQADTDSECTLVTITAQNTGALQSTASYNGWPTATTVGYPQGFRPFVRVLYGNQAASTQVDVDLNRGVQFTVGCSSVSVSLGLDSVGSNKAVAMQLAASISFFGTSPSAPLTKTSYIDQLAASGTQNVILPTFAQQLLPVQMYDGANPNTAQCRLDFKDATATVITSLPLSTPGAQVTPIPVSSDIYSVDVVNTGSNTANYRLVWQLCF